MEDTVFIIGDSPYLGEVEDTIYYIVDKYPTIGINNTIKRYNISTHIFQDIEFATKTSAYPEVKTVAPIWCDALIRKENKELYDSFTFNFKTDTEKDIIKDGKLAWCGFTHDYAISYCILKGYRNVILIGAADFMGNSHYLTDEKFRYSEKLKVKSKRFIEEFCLKRINIMTCNVESALEVPRVLSLDNYLR